MENKFVSGEWSGFFLESHRQSRGWMHLYLTFENGTIRGEGTDYVGPWVAEGNYDEKSGACRWTKQYVGRHQVLYQGICGRNGIQGEWKILTTGPFHIWPRTHGYLDEMYLRDELEFSARSSPSILLEPASGQELV
jgi:hypothetical protein